jgi:SGNH domain (fused to AT3 domains)
VRVSNNSRFALRTLAVASLLALLATNAWQGDGWAWRFPSLSLSAEQIKKGELDRFRKIPDSCTLINLSENKHCNLDAKLQMLVLGNSTEVDGYNFVSAGFGEDNDLNLILFGGIEGCAFRQESGRIVTRDEKCQKRLDALFDPAISARFNFILYSANLPYGGNKHIFLAILQQLKLVNPKIQILTMGGYIKNQRACAYYINKTNSTDACALPENVKHFENDPKDQPMFDQFRAIESHYIDRVDLLCKNRVLQTCRTRTEGGIPVTYDGVHHSLEFAEMSGRLYAKKHPELLSDLTHP